MNTREHLVSINYLFGNSSKTTTIVCKANSNFTNITSISNLPDSVSPYKTDGVVYYNYYVSSEVNTGDDTILLNLYKYDTQFTLIHSYTLNERDYDTSDVSNIAITAANNMIVVKLIYSDYSRYVILFINNDKLIYNNTYSGTLSNTTRDMISKNNNYCYIEKNSSTLVVFQLQSDGVRRLSLNDGNYIYYNTYDSDVVSENVLNGKIGYNASGKVTGTMPNNGELNYNSSTEEQTIPAGYTSGGTIASAPLTNTEYDECLELSEQILGENVSL